MVKQEKDGIWTVTDGGRKWSCENEDDAQYLSWLLRVAAWEAQVGGYSYRSSGSNDDEEE